MNECGTAREGGCEGTDQGVPGVGALCCCHLEREQPTTVGCFPGDASPLLRIAQAGSAVRDDGEPLAVLAHLLRLCRDRAEWLGGAWGERDLSSRAATALAEARARIEQDEGLRTLGRLAREAIADALLVGGEVDGVRCAHLLAVDIDRVHGGTFGDSFRSRAPYQPGVGDPVPIESPDIRQFLDMPPTTPPWRLVQRFDQTRRVRLAGAWAAQYRVVYEFPNSDGPLLTGDTVIAACQPNRRLTELSVPGEHQPAYPVGPVDPDRQREAIDGQIRTAVAAGASVVVVPELSVTPGLSDHLHNWVHRDDGPRLLVTGTFHERSAQEGAGTARRANTGMLWLRGVDHPLVHRKHTPAQAPFRETLDVELRPVLHIWVLPGGWRLTLAICRDLLDPQAVHALSEAVVNVVLVPVMSESLRPFVASAAQLVGLSQAFVVVANNPADWGDGLPRAADAALFGHPGLGQLTRLVPSERLPGVTLMRIGSASITRLASSTPETSRSGVPATEPPQWARALVAEVGSRAIHGGTNGLPRRGWVRAAVLVLLRAGGSTGASVLLTRRADDLTDYPDVLSFPGGAVDDGDTDPVSTALREAAEEVGLEPGSVRVLGLLPDFALAESWFIVTPVVAWSPEPVFTHGANAAEVSALVWHDVGAPPVVPAVRPGRMTQAVLYQLAGAHARGRYRE